MKKLLLGMGTIVSAAAPVAAVVACGDKDESNVNVSALNSATTAIGGLNSQSGKVAIHYVFAKSQEYTTFGDVTSDSGEVTLYKETDGAWKVSHSATWALPFFNKTGVWLMTGTRPTAEQVTAGLADIATFKTAHSSKDLTFEDVTRINSEIVAAVAKGKIELKAGDKIVINDLKHDSNSYKDHLGVHQLNVDHLRLVAGATWSQAFNLTK